jgi:hypothetical protein
VPVPLPHSVTTVHSPARPTQVQEQLQYHREALELVDEQQPGSSAAPGGLLTPMWRMLGSHQEVMAAKKEALGACMRSVGGLHLPALPDGMMVPACMRRVGGWRGGVRCLHCLPK